MILITYLSSHLHELTGAAIDSSVFLSLRKTNHVNRDKFPPFSKRFKVTITFFTASISIIAIINS